MSRPVGEIEIVSLSGYLEEDIEDSEAEIIYHTQRPMDNISYIRLMAYIISFFISGSFIYSLISSGILILNEKNVFGFSHFILTSFLLGSIFTGIYYYFYLSPKEEVYILSSDRVCKFFIDDSFDEPINYAGLKEKNKYYEKDEKGEFYNEIKFEHIDEVIECPNKVKIHSEKEVKEMTFKRHPKIIVKNYTNKRLTINSDEVIKKFEDRRLVNTI